MSNALRILILEDNVYDAELEIAVLEEAGYSCKWERVETREDFLKRLESPKYDLILADYSLPSFNGLAALELFHELKLDIPFVVISGTIGEEIAIESLKAGATDYVMKDRSSRLVPVVKRALGDREERIKLKQAEAESRRLEEQLIQAQKMESIGTLAGGVAHDFNNLLTAIIGNAQLAQMSIGKSDPAQAYLANIESAAELASSLTRQLLAFSRRQLLECKKVDLNDTIDNFMKMLRRIIGEDVEVRLRLAQNLSPATADPVQIEQVIMNLAVNARDAMPNGGYLIIETRNAELNEDYCRDRAWAKPGLYVLLIVSDTGSGIDSETIQRIFEPFFTTKEIGRGTGLGLSVVYGIVKQHGGLIEVSSEPGYGASFKVYLPAAEASEEKAVEKSVTELRGGTETVLVAEDEDHLRLLVENVLTDLGYKVILACNGVEAVEKFVVAGEKIDLVILDLVMPRMGGLKAYELIREIRDVPAIFTTGYSSEITQNNLSSGSNTSMLHKPYGIEDLGRKVRSALGPAK